MNFASECELHEEVVHAGELGVERGDSKMCAKFVGLFWVIDKRGDVNYRIQETEEGRPQVVHHSRMKPYTSRQPVIKPNWVKRISITLEALAGDTQEVTNPVTEPKPAKKVQ